MAEELRTSFIPKKNIYTEKVSQGNSFFLLISTIVFIVTIMSAGGIFLYKRFLISEISRSSVALEKERGVFESALIQELSRVDMRMDFVKKILKQHIAPSMIFRLLENLTLKDLRFSGFSYAMSDDGVINITMDGEAKSYATVVLQSKIFGDSKYVKNALFSNLNVNTRGVVVFNFTASIDPRYVSYENRLKEDSLEVETESFESSSIDDQRLTELLDSDDDQNMTNSSSAQ